MWCPGWHEKAELCTSTGRKGAPHTVYHLLSEGNAGNNFRESVNTGDLDLYDPGPPLCISETEMKGEVEGCPPPTR